ncbi:MAG: type II toxin-antitoxin system RelE/ParE family toxin [Candidatus Woesearchaeota archaeon]|nr:type II toxin-antitoxin system RelE/ParE family toxin [Candidatus Woesearchaeota archaeon]
MKYDVHYDPKSEKQLEKLAPLVARRIVLKLKQVGENGQGIEPLTAAPYGYKIRIGDYRVLVDLTFNPDTLWVRFIDHRARIYKRM